MKTIKIFNDYFQEILIKINSFMEHHEPLEFFAIKTIQIDWDGCFIILKNGVEYVGIIIKDVNASKPFKKTKLVFKLEAIFYGRSEDQLYTPFSYVTTDFESFKNKLNEVI